MLLSAILDIFHLIDRLFDLFPQAFHVRSGLENMSDRKAELERKRKRLEEIKRAREEKKKVRMLE